MYQCDDCGKLVGSLDEMKVTLPDIPNLGRRLDIGGVVPAGECPDCGALMYLCKETDALRCVQCQEIVDIYSLRAHLLDHNGDAAMDMTSEQVRDQFTEVEPAMPGEPVEDAQEGPDPFEPSAEPVDQPDLSPGPDEDYVGDYDVV